MARRIAYIAATVVVGLAVGFACMPESEASKYRQAVLLQQEPAGSVTIEDARKNIESETSIVLTTRIGARELPQWWLKDSASFYVSEATPGSHYNADADHDPNTCPFCRQKWKVEDSMALVRLVDDSGAAIPTPAPELLQVQEGDIVVIEGTGSLDDSGSLVIESRGLFVRR